MYKIECITTDYFMENIWLISNRDQDAVLIDPGPVAAGILIDFIKDKNCKPIAIINTHAHPDHIAAVAELQDYFKIGFYLHKKEQTVLKNVNNLATMVGMDAIKIPEKINWLPSGRLDVGGFPFEVLHTPGHTPGSICLKIGHHLFSGDTLFNNSIGRVDLPGGSMTEMKKSIEILKELERDLVVYPGHGTKTTIGNEIDNNPYF